MGKPKIRFKGFTEDWEQRKLGEVVSVCSGKDYKHLDEGNIPVYGTGGYMLSVSEALSNDSDAIGIGRKGTIDKPYILKAPFWTVDTLFYCIPHEKNDLSFVFSTFQNINWKAMDESTGVPSLSKTAINCVDVITPLFEEQKKIGCYFSNLDHLITLHQRKCDETKKLKNYMLQKMFPQNGMKVPEIRFGGFTGDWEQRKLLDISDIVTGTTPQTKDKDNYDGNRLFVSPADIQGNRFIERTITTLTEKGHALGRELRPGTSLFVSIGSTIGKVAQIEEFVTTNQQINAVIPYDKMEDDFVFTMLENEADKIKKLSAQQAVPIINKSTFGNIEVKYPKKEEQMKIGKYFKELDHLITLHQRKCDELMKIKKYMLQNMFV
jgi:type I restriction enzyme S subunit